MKTKFCCNRSFKVSIDLQCVISEKNPFTSGKTFFHCLTIFKKLSFRNYLEIYHFIYRSSEIISNDINNISLLFLWLNVTGAKISLNHIII